MAQAIAFINPRLTTTNVGDLFIEDSVKRLLKFDPAQSIDIDPRKPITRLEIEQINRRDAAVIVGTNLWYRSLCRPGRWCFTAEQLKQIRVPIIPFGVGTTRHAGEDNGFDAETLEQLRIIHDRCELGSARDRRTAEVLAEAGIRNVVLTGCPTLYRSLKPRWRLDWRPDRRRVVLTVRYGQRRNVRRLVRILREMGLQPIVAAQQRRDVFLRRSLPLLQRRVPTVFRFELRPYLHLIEHTRGAIGWRLHGNMLHLAAGKPAVFFANCSRAHSFCETFGLPCELVPDGESLSGKRLLAAAERLFDPACFEPLAQSYVYYRAEMVRFLEANHLAHHLGPAGRETESLASGRLPLRSSLPGSGPQGRKAA